VSRKKKQIRLLVCDLDNTLYDWFAFFVPSFYAMVDKAVEVTECDREVLLDDFREVHQRHHDSEHPFSLLETNTIQRIFPNSTNRQIAEALDPAFHAYNSKRKEKLKLHRGVKRTLEILERSDIRLVAHTESKLYPVVDRLSRFDLTRYFSKIYCRERSLSDHPFPENSGNWLRDFPMEKVVELSKHQSKPNTDVLLEICSEEGFEPEEAAYVGDSMARDMLMAKGAGVFAIWAAYGANHDPDQYARLVRITHWTKEDVEREIELKEAAKKVEPDFVAEDSFADMLQAIAVREPTEIRSRSA
jgi:phosphoglycolate phosphatase